MSGQRAAVIRRRGTPSRWGRRRLPSGSRGRHRVVRPSRSITHTRSMKGFAWPSAQSACRRGRLAPGGRDGTVRIWDPITRDTVREPLTGHDQWVLSMTSFRDGEGPELLATASRDNGVRLWNPDTGATLHELPNHDDWIRTVSSVAGAGRHQANAARKNPGDLVPEGPAGQFSRAAVNISLCSASQVRMRSQRSHPPRSASA
ncbi:hypothetical protein ABZ454_23640 [Streptomyces sp. NPDC005803]|uniref:WD40 repeat domain-containing protein n=1 Tax=Streptomyces sp. NPDC005803 TaxID=3154297 RepID=UPI0033EEA86A